MAGVARHGLQGLAHAGRIARRPARLPSLGPRCLRLPSQAPRHLPLTALQQPCRLSSGGQPLPPSGRSGRVVAPRQAAFDTERALAAATGLAGVHRAIAAFAATKQTHGHVAFIEKALSHLDGNGIVPTLATYNALLDVFPKGAGFQNRSLLDALMPRETPQREVAMKLLQHMEDGGVIPEGETHAILLRAFGKASTPVHKVRRMAYWMRRFLFANPFATPRGLPSDPAEIAKVALQRIARRHSFIIDCSERRAHDDTEVSATAGVEYILGAHTPAQTKLADELGRMDTTVVKVAGPRHFWFGQSRIPYLLLTASTSASQEYVLGVALATSLSLPTAQRWLAGLAERAPGIEDATVVVEIRDRERVAAHAAQHEDGQPVA